MDHSVAQRNPSEDIELLPNQNRTSPSSPASTPTRANVSVDKLPAGVGEDKNSQIDVAHNVLFVPLPQIPRSGRPDDHDDGFAKHTETDAVPSVFADNADDSVPMGDSTLVRNRPPPLLSPTDAVQSNPAVVSEDLSRHGATQGVEKDESSPITSKVVSQIGFVAHSSNSANNRLGGGAQRGSPRNNTALTTRDKSSRASPTLSKMVEMTPVSNAQPRNSSAHGAATEFSVPNGGKGGVDIEASSDSSERSPHSLGVGNGQQDVHYLGEEEGHTGEAHGLVKYASHLDNFVISLPSGAVTLLMMVACALGVMGLGGSQFFGDAYVLERNSVSSTQETIVVRAATVHLYLFKASFVTRDGNDRIFQSTYSTKRTVYDGPTESGTDLITGVQTTFVLPDGTSNVALYCAQNNIPVSSLFQENSYFKLGACKGVFHRLHASFALGIIASVSSFLAGLFAFVRVCLRTAASKMSVVLSCLVSLIFLSASAALSASVYDMDLCGRDSYQRQGFHFNFGLALLFASVGLSLISFIWALVTK